MTALLGLTWTRVARLSHIWPLIPVSPLPNRPACVRNVLQNTGERQKTRQVTFVDSQQTPNNLNTVLPCQASCTGSTVYPLELIIVVISLTKSIRDTSHRPPGASSVLFVGGTGGRMTGSVCRIQETTKINVFQKLGSPDSDPLMGFVMGPKSELRS